MVFEKEIRELADLYEERSRVQRNILYKREILRQNELILKSVDARIKQITSGENGKLIQTAYETLIAINRTR
jgi:hypothetical protein